MNEFTPATLKTVLARKGGEWVSIEPWVAAWEADIKSWQLAVQAWKDAYAERDAAHNVLFARIDALEAVVKLTSAVDELTIGSPEVRELQARIEALLEHRRVFGCGGVWGCAVCDRLIADLREAQHE